MQSIIIQGKVHFYEFMQIQILQEYIQKGISFFIDSICNSHPKLINFRYYVEQISLLVNFIKDFYYLSKYNANYAEYFYGLERESLQNKKFNGIVKTLRLLYHTAINTILPYFMNKIQLYYNKIKQQEENQGLILNKIQKIFTKIYPYFYCIVNLIQVIMKFRYLLFQKVKYYDLHYKLSNTTLKYAEQQEQQEGKTHYPWKDLLKSPGLLIILVSHKVLTWYFNNKNQRNQAALNQQNSSQKNFSPLSFVSMIEKSKLKKGQMKSIQPVKKYKTGICLICSKRIINATVIKQNGHVYCYNCIYPYVQEHKECPITHIKVTTQSLQLIYS